MKRELEKRIRDHKESKIIIHGYKERSIQSYQKLLQDMEDLNQWISKVGESDDGRVILVAVEDFWWEAVGCLLGALKNHTIIPVLINEMEESKVRFHRILHQIRPDFILTDYVHGKTVSKMVKDIEQQGIRRFNNQKRFKNKKRVQNYQYKEEPYVYQYKEEPYLYQYKEELYLYQYKEELYLYQLNTDQTVKKDQGGWILFSSGSVNEPKGVIISNENMEVTIQKQQEFLELSHQDGFMYIGGLKHITGLSGFILALWCGMDYHQMAHKVFFSNPIALFICLWKERITVVKSIVTVFEEGCKSLNEDKGQVLPKALELSHIRHIILGGERLWYESFQNMEELLMGLGLKKHVINPSYGLTETTFNITGYQQMDPVRTLFTLQDSFLEGEQIQMADYNLQKNQEGITLVSVGRAGVLCELRIRLKNRDVTLDCIIGEVELKGENLSKAYTGYENQVTMDLDGWLATGDLGFVWDGYLYLVGRKKDILIRNGKNLHCMDLERWIMESFFVEKCKVLGISGKRDRDKKQIEYEEIVCFVQAKEDESLCNKRQMAEEIGMVLGKKAGVQPDQIVFLKEFPKLLSSKMDLMTLRQDYINGRFESETVGIVDSYRGKRGDTKTKHIKNILYEDHVVLDELFYMISANTNIFQNMKGCGLFANQIELRDSSLMSADKIKAYSMDLFLLGCHSLDIIKIAGMVEMNYHIPCSASDILLHNSLLKIADLIQVRQKEVVKKADFNQEEKSEISLNQIQKMILDHYDRNPDSLFYNETVAFRIKGELDVKKLTKVCQDIILANPIFQLGFIKQNGKWKGIIKDISVNDVIEVINEPWEDEKKQKINELIRPFDLSNAPLIHIKVITDQTKLANKQSLLLLDVHHGIMDFSGQNRFIHMMSKKMMGEVGKFPNDHKAFWKLFKKGPQVDSGNNYLEGLFTNENGSSFSDCMRGKFHKSLSKEIHFFFCPDMEDEIHLIPKFLLAYMLVLAEQQGNNDIVVGNVFGQRTTPFHEGVMGSFIQTIPIPMVKEHVSTLEEGLSLFLDSYYKAVDLIHYDLYETIKESDYLTKKNLFSYLFMYQPEKEEVLRIPRCECERIPIAKQECGGDIFLTVRKALDGFDFQIVYDGNLYLDSRIQYMADRMRYILEHPKGNLQEEVPYIHQFMNGLKNWGEKTALTMIEDSGRKEYITYLELGQMVTDLRNWFMEKGVRAKDQIAVFMNPSLERIEILLGILSCGAAYIPLDASMSKERRDLILQEGKISFLVADPGVFSEEENEFFVVKEQGSISKKQGVFFEIKWQEVFNNIECEQQREVEDLAYVIFTSGSTGMPKGVKVTNKNLSNLIMGMERIISMKECENFLCLTTYTFDIFVVEALFPLAYGKHVIMGEPDAIKNGDLVAMWIREFHLDWMQTTPFGLRILMNCKSFQKALKDMNTLFIGGEALEMELLKSYQSSLPKYVWNMYGPTETTVWSCGFEVTKFLREDKGEIEICPIGRPIRNTQFQILYENETGGPGEKGELIIRGDGVSAGYLNSEELTKANFHGGYHTKDLVSVDSNGFYHFHGRMDDQIKRQGFRIEPKEIQEAARKCGISDSVALLWKGTKNENEILLFYLEKKEIDSNQLKREMSRYLSGYMMPDHVIPLEYIPHTANLKTDKKALLDIYKKRLEYQVDPNTEAWELLHLRIMQVLGVDYLEESENLHSLGLRSLGMIKILNRIEELWGISFTYGEIFAMDTYDQIRESIVKKLQALHGDEDDVKMEAQKGTLLNSETEEVKWDLSICQRLVLTRSMTGNKKGNMDSWQEYLIPFAIELDNEFGPNQIMDGIHQVLHAQAELFTIVKQDEDLFMNQKVKKPDFKIAWSYVVVEQGQNEWESIRGKAKELGEELAKNGSFYGCHMYIGKKIWLVCYIHHGMADEETIRLFFRELLACLKGEGLSEKEHSYRDFCRRLDGINRERKNKVDEDNIKLLMQHQGLFKDYMVQKKHYTSGFAKKDLSKKMVTYVKILCQKWGITEYIFGMGMLFLVLSNFSLHTSKAILSPVSLRKGRGEEDVFGMFGNTLLFAMEMEEEDTFFQYFQKVKKMVIHALDYKEIFFMQDYAMDLEKDMNLSDSLVLFVYRDGEEERERAKLHWLDNTKTSFPMVFFWETNGEERILKIQFAKELYFSHTMDEILDQLEFYMEHQMTPPGKEIKLKDIQLCDRQKKQQILLSFQGEKVSFSNEKTILDLFLEQVVSCSTKTALKWENGTITYKELDQLTDYGRDALIERGVVGQVPIVVHMKRSQKVIMALFAILKAQGIFVYLDPDWPVHRKETIINDCLPKMIITEVDSMWSIEDIQCLIWEELEQKGKKENYQNPCVSFVHTMERNPDNLAYILYTSGTTGRPKGVMVPHKGIVNLAHHFQREQRITAEDVCLQFSKCSFDAMMAELAMSLLLGGTLVILSEEEKKDPEKFMERIKDQGITAAVLTPSFIKTVKNLSIKHLISAGETIDVGTYQTNKEWGISNDYGPTETSVCATHYSFDKNLEKDRRVPIGRPIQNVNVYIMDGDRLSTILQPGEIVIGGLGVSKGYLNDKNTSDKVFVKDPYTGKVMFRTGDLGRWLPDGSLEFLGRKDSQIKVNGYRIEKEEIETWILKLSGIKDCAVVFHKNENEEIFALFYAASHEMVEQIKEHLKQRIPEYLCPRIFVRVDQIPVTLHGKRDEIKLRQLLTTDCKELIFQSKMDLVRLWRLLLNNNRIKEEDDVLFCGADSMTIIRAVEKLKEYGIVVRVMDIYRYPVICDFYEKIADQLKYEIRLNIKGNQDNLSWQQVSCFHKPIGIIMEYFFKFGFYMVVMDMAGYQAFSSKDVHEIYSEATMIEDFCSYEKLRMDPVLGISAKEERIGMDLWEKRVCQLLQNNCPILLYVDSSQIPYATEYMERPKPHYLILKGYSKHKRVFYVLDNLHVMGGAEPIYRDMAIPFETVQNSALFYGKNFRGSEDEIRFLFFEKRKETISPLEFLRLNLAERLSYDSYFRKWENREWNTMSYAHFMMGVYGMETYETCEMILLKDLMGTVREASWQKIIADIRKTRDEIVQKIRFETIPNESFQKLQKQIQRLKKIRKKVAKTPQDLFFEEELGLYDKERIKNHEPGLSQVYMENEELVIVLSPKEVYSMWEKTDLAPGRYWKVSKEKEISGVWLRGQKKYNNSFQDGIAVFLTKGCPICFGVFSPEVGTLEIGILSKNATDDFYYRRYLDWEGDIGLLIKIKEENLEFYIQNMDTMLVEKIYSLNEITTVMEYGFFSRTWEKKGHIARFGEIKIQ